MQTLSDFRHFSLIATNSAFRLVYPGFLRAIRCGDSSCQLPSRWRKANGNDCIRNSCMMAFSDKCPISAIPSLAFASRASIFAELPLVLRSRFRL